MSLKNLPDFTLTPEAELKLKQYEALLHKWQKSLNIVAPSTLGNSWERHFRDSVQAAGLVSRETKTVYDLGSGGGFPGLVLAICHPDTKFHLIETDQKKCQFLKTVSRETNTPVIVHTERVENVDIPAPDIITARALASLEKLLGWTEKWWSGNEGIKLVFLKGAKTEEEISEAQKFYQFDFQIFQSKIEQESRIIMLTSIRRIP